jgi:hypothetical protein
MIPRMSLSAGIYRQLGVGSNLDYEEKRMNGADIDDAFVNRVVGP